ncbi:type II toxin-antitoxin system RelE family toxin [Bartonella sp. A05]|uniref:type II toxin-antitoxin system RelE family toxin n=1 Tax=Bartonella sp. A05 TaxID=2967261 RepID=UPI0022A9203B|nr:type II toxin-antitoxin system RelE/ParE family toxin [Bartonella sp. A05]MCZ2204426.1 type II toxin-antitoxin system RelE/ParE family toxin [Bartonella sp. A05]
MIFNIEFDERALNEWKKIDKAIREQFKKKLQKLQSNPYIESARLYGDLAGCYKIKLRSSGFRLVYQVIDKEIVILVVAVGKREDKKVYELASARIQK